MRWELKFVRNWLYFILKFLFFYFRFMNNRAPSNKRYQPTEYEHAANCATHAVSYVYNALNMIVCIKYMQYLCFEKEDKRFLIRYSWFPLNDELVFVAILFSALDHSQPFGWSLVVLPVWWPLGGDFSVALRGGAVKPFHHIHRVPYGLLEEESSSVKTIRLSIPGTG